MVPSRGSSPSPSDPSCPLRGWVPAVPPIVKRVLYCPGLQMRMWWCVCMGEGVLREVERLARDHREAGQDPHPGHPVPRSLSPVASPSALVTWVPQPRAAVSRLQAPQQPGSEPLSIGPRA